MNYLLSYVTQYTNYNITNVNNLHNFHYNIMLTMDEHNRKSFINNMKLTIGNTYASEFRLYIFKKIPKSELLTYF